MTGQQEFHAATRRAFFVPGMTWPREMTELARLFKDSLLHAEVGVFCGKSLYVTAAAMRHLGNQVGDKRIVAVDDFSERLQDGMEMLPSKTWWTTVLLATIDAIRSEYSVAIDLIDNNSTSAALALIHQPQFDSVYLDANHAEEYIGQDICSWWPLVKDGGLLAGHDYSSDQLSVMNAVNCAFGDTFVHIPSTRIWYVVKDSRSESQFRLFQSSI